MLGVGEIALYNFDEGMSEGQRLTYYIFDPPDRWNIYESIRPRMFVNTNIDVQFQALGRHLSQGLDILPIDEDGSLVWSVRESARLNGGYHFVLAGMIFLPGVSFGYPLEGADPVDLMVQSCDVGALPEDAHPLVQAAWLKESLPQGRFEKLHRARRLLMECLSPSQREELEEHDQFHTRGADGHVYRIKRGFGHNVYRLDETGHPVAEYCIIINDWSIPDYDLMLAQKLLLDTNPHEFEAVSNIRLLNRMRF